MHSSITEAILGDPIVVLELCTLVFTFGFVVKASCSQNIDGSLEGVSFGSSAEIARSSKRGGRRSRLGEHLRSFFEVGTLISLPKQSLNGQRALRKL